MKKLLFFALLALVLTCSACGGSSAYAEYARAYKMLRQAESFANTHHEVLHQFEAATGQESDMELLLDIQVAKTEAGYDGIGNMFLSGKVNDDVDEYSTEEYYRAGRRYCVVHEADRDEDNRLSTDCDPDYAFIVATQGVFDLTQALIASQSAEDTPEGRLLTFTLAPEKFYERGFKKYYSDIYLGFREPPSYTVLLDEEGRLKQVLFSYYLVGAEAEPSFLQSDTQVDFRQFGDIELDFPELNQKDYPDYTAPVQPAPAE